MWEYLFDVEKCALFAFEMKIKLPTDTRDLNYSIVQYVFMSMKDLLQGFKVEGKLNLRTTVKLI
jgi:hypothetical protein